MPDYLLSCTCGQKLTVSSRQAGESLRCNCGTILEVPTMRGLRELEVVPTAGSTRVRSWGGRQQAVLLLVACAILLVGIAGYLAWARPADPRPAPPPELDANVSLPVAMEAAKEFAKGPGSAAGVLSLEARRLAKIARADDLGHALRVGAGRQRGGRGRGRAGFAHATKTLTCRTRVRRVRRPQRNRRSAPGSGTRGVGKR